MDERIHVPKTEYYNISTDLNTERAIVEEKEPCSTELEQSRTEETRAKRSGSNAEPACYTKSIIPIKERK